MVKKKKIKKELRLWYDCCSCESNNYYYICTLNGGSINPNCKIFSTGNQSQIQSHRVQYEFNKFVIFEQVDRRWPYIKMYSYTQKYLLFMFRLTQQFVHINIQNFVRQSIFALIVKHSSITLWIEKLIMAKS